MLSGKKSKYWYLSHFSLSKRLNNKDLHYFCNNSIMRNYVKGDRIYYNDGFDDHIYFLKKGSLSISKVQESGNELMIGLVKQRSIFGISKLLNSSKSADYEVAIALESCIICMVHSKILMELMEKNESLNNYILKLAGFQIKRLENRLEDVIFKSSEERIREFLTKFIKNFGVNLGAYIEADLMLTNKNIAKLTNTTRQKVNVVMNLMRKERIIEYDKKKLRLLN